MKWILYAITTWLTNEKKNSQPPVRRVWKRTYKAFNSNNRIIEICRYRLSSARQKNEWVMRANERTDEWMAHCSTRRFHIISTQSALVVGRLRVIDDAERVSLCRESIADCLFFCKCRTLFHYGTICLFTLLLLWGGEGEVNLAWWMILYFGWLWFMNWKGRAYLAFASAVERRWSELFSEGEK